MIIAIKGYIGSGKSTISKKLEEEYNYSVIEADKVVHDLYEGEALRDEIVKKLNIEKFDRKLIGGVVFNNPEKLAILESIVHPLLEEQINNFIEEKKENIIIDCQVIDKLNIEYDYEIMTYCSKDETIKRIIKRDNKTQEQIEAILENQEKYKIQTKKIFTINTEEDEDIINSNLKKIIGILTKDKNKPIYDDDDDEDDDDDFYW